MVKLIDLIGKKFERLEVIERAENNKWSHTVWYVNVIVGI